MARITGTVRWFNETKGFGFLGYAGGRDVFVHYSSIDAEEYRTLKEGDAVEFDIVRGLNGPQADKVRLLQMLAA